MEFPVYVGMFSIYNFRKVLSVVYMLTVFQPALKHRHVEICYHSLSAV